MLVNFLWTLTKLDIKISAPNIGGMLGQEFQSYVGTLLHLLIGFGQRNSPLVKYFILFLLFDFIVIFLSKNILLLYSILCIDRICVFYPEACPWVC